MKAGSGMNVVYDDNRGTHTVSVNPKTNGGITSDLGVDVDGTTITINSNGKLQIDTSTVQSTTVRAAN